VVHPFDGLSNIEDATGEVVRTLIVNAENIRV
jgi:hypothetical protein